MSDKGPEDWDYRLIHRIAMILVFPLIPLIRLYALIRWYWLDGWDDLKDCYKAWWKSFKAGDPNVL